MSSHEVVEYFAEFAKKLRDDHVARFQNLSLLHQHSSTGTQDAPTQGVVGGFVRGYRFRYDGQQSIAQGSMTLVLGDECRDFNVTIVILRDQEGGETAERIVANTTRVADHCDSVLDAYFCAPCSMIGRWIVAYEQFDGPFTADNSLPRFFQPEGNKTRLTYFWKEKIRSFNRALSLARDRDVVHGGLTRTSSYYVVSSRTVKLINWGRHQDSSTAVGDLNGLNTYIWRNQFLNVRGKDWEGFHYLLGTRRMRHQ